MLPGGEIEPAGVPGLDRAAVVAVLRDPASWLRAVRATPHLCPGGDDARLEVWRSFAEEVLDLDPGRTRLLLHHRLPAGARAVAWPLDPPPLPIDRLAPLAGLWHAALARTPLSATPARVAPVPKAPEEIARLITGLARRGPLSGRPGWSVGRPVLGAERVLLPILGGAEPFSLVVEPAERAHLPAFSGRNLAAGVLGEGWAPDVVDALGRLVLALDREGLAFPVARDARRVELFLSSACNLRCSFCMESERISQRSFMPWDTLEARIRGYAASGVELVQFMGGEATVHPRFVDALRLCRDLGLRTYVITNLLAWGDRAFAEATAPLLDEVMVSLHAFGEEAGARVTGQRGWWGRFQRAHTHFRETTGASRIRASTVLSRRSAPDLDAIADLLLALRPQRWIMGNAVPISGARLDAVDEGLTLTELRALRPALAALHARCANAGCQLVFFCFPHCVLGPELWDSTHDDIVGDQDLSDDAPRATEQVNFWSRADYDVTARPVTLGRTRPPICAGCARRGRCGGHFTDYFERHGTGELRPVEASEQA
jgi:MoaA/NifB/PqqE/SkfB family radical SAM enzyme